MNPIRSVNHFLIFLFSVSLMGQNLLEEDFENWTEGRGSVPGFRIQGDYDENIREYEEGPGGQERLVWKATPNSEDDTNGGFASDGVQVGQTGVRFSVWLKKTGGLQGNVFISPSAFGIVNLDGSTNFFPIFMNETLPDLDEWFLAVGYVHDRDYIGSGNLGRIYRESGEEVGILPDFKSDGGMGPISLIVALAFDNTPGNSLWITLPRKEEVNGSEPSIEELLEFGAPPEELSFVYDGSGNQILRQLPDNSSGTLKKEADLPLMVAQDEDLAKLSFHPLYVSTEAEADHSEFHQEVLLSPNPVTDQLTITWGNEQNKYLEQIELMDLSGKSIPVAFKGNSNEAYADLSAKPAGLYLIKVTFKNGSTVEKKVIKR